MDESESLLEYKKNIFTQNGEDGIINTIFQKIGIRYHFCCEFGAWDGLHLSNTRNLILNGWNAILIEGDTEKFKELEFNYKDNSKVISVNVFVDSNDNSLENIFSKYLPGKIPATKDLDFLSIDIDGLDDKIFENLHINPRVICIEVNAGHSPENITRIPDEIASNNVGQPFGIFANIAKEKGYALVCYSGNAFFIKKSELMELKELSPRDAYIEFLNHLSPKERFWLYLVNNAKVQPNYKYHNPFLTAKRLDIGLGKRLIIYLGLGAVYHNFMK